MRYTGIIDAPELTHVAYVSFETIDAGAAELAAFVAENPGLTPTMEVGEPGDETPSWMVTTTPDGAQQWVVTNTSTTPARNVEFTLA